MERTSSLYSSSSAYLEALTREISKKLTKALASPVKRRSLLQDLFTDIALEVDERAKDIVLDRNKDEVSSTEEDGDDPLCFFNVLADHYMKMPDRCQDILDLILKLWTQSFASHIFTLLFHKWLFEVQLDDQEILLRYSSALVQGATNVFWMDIQTNTQHFKSLFWYLFEEVALNPSRLSKIPIQAHRNLFLLLSRFILFYNSVDQLGSFFKHFPEFPDASVIGGSVDLFVIELTNQMQKIRVEPVLIHYLSQMKLLQGCEGMEVGMRSRARLKACLYNFTSSGSPMYPTTALRQAARDTLDALFPEGRGVRSVIRQYMRIWQPWDWPSFSTNFLISLYNSLQNSYNWRISST